MPSVTYSVSKPSAPESVQILTSGNYTVPVGKIAKVSANCSGGATVSLNGSVVLTGAAWSTMVSNISPTIVDASTSESNIFNQTSNYYGKAIAFQNGTTGIPVTRVAGGFFAAFKTNIAVTGAPGDAFANATAQSSANAQYSVPAGTVIATSGGSCVIEIYSA